MSIVSFAENYAKSGISRFHMPGHKGVKLHGCEPLDLTEIAGADFLFEPHGIILESERRTAAAYASAVTCYSTEGTSLSIKAALCAAMRYFGGKLTVAAGRNCHRAFLNACALLDIDPVWIPCECRNLLCEYPIVAKAVERCLTKNKINAVYITSPDYTGGMADIEAIAKICHKHGALLICDNAHGAYLKFCESPLHPLNLGTDLVCDSAHKTLPVYTGGGYLHLSKAAPAELAKELKPAMALFGSTSPSYLIMESLDLCSYELTGTLPEKIAACCQKTAKLKKQIAEYGYENISAEPMKITINAEKSGYTGTELAALMRAQKIECEYADPSVVVLMPSPYNSEEDFERLENFFDKTTPRQGCTHCGTEPTVFTIPKKAMTIREAMFSLCRKIDISQAAGKICARAAMSCQPSVAIVMAGEAISEQEIILLERYGITEIDVVY